MKALLVALVLLCVAGTCEAQMTPAVVQADALRLTPVLFVYKVEPPPIYAVWYADTERCSGLTGDYSKVRWYLTPTPWAGVNGLTFGMWQDGHRITLNYPERLDSTLVMHEIMHDLLADNGLNNPTNPHPSLWFGEKRCVYEFHPDVKP